MTARRELDALVASRVYGWTEIQPGEGAEAQARGKPPRGLRRKVPRYTEDLRLALNAARRVVESGLCELEVKVEREELRVTAHRASQHDRSLVAQLSVARAADLPEAVVSIILSAIQRGRPTKERSNK